MFNHTEIIRLIPVPISLSCQLKVLKLVSVEGSEVKDSETGEVRRLALEEVSSKREKI